MILKFIHHKTKDVIHTTEKPVALAPNKGEPIVLDRKTYTVNSRLFFYNLDTINIYCTQF